MNFKTLIPALLIATTASGFGMMATTNATEAAPIETTVVVAEVGKEAPAFTLMDTDGKKVSLADFKGKTVVLEWFCPTCPYSGGRGGDKSIHASGRVGALMTAMKKADPDAVYLLIDSSTVKMRTTAEKLAEQDAAIKKKLGISAPILIDADTGVAKAYGAKATPHVFVIDGEGVLRYQGAFDDQRRGGSDLGTNYVLTSVTAIKKGEKVEPTYVKQYGCGVRTN
jgi:cytochrome oxidase Cu insertion factor (SCO1/SenC/PrrC family)